ncbi:PREDICTED: ribonucleoside-diphosphate reductase large subunit-like isoform X2 [Cyphomyrmex costatus]|uniref:ribonucleoside-diphosphate reductase large subunit-like isoform X2 n=1 Tax=Cyphomyrmex costatus TaxID=456900 RepID=UPI000852419E|nr:PREDICTED: ribonucleoside-diphosphate reductase large subunit-like isoform X2 [Cyphomyrmex costatus]
MSGDSIDGILDTLERFAVLCHHNGEVGFNVHCIRAKNTPIRDTGGEEQLRAKGSICYGLHIYL